MAKVFVRVTVKAKGLKSFKIGAWREYEFLPRIGELVCVASSICEEQFTDQIYLLKVSCISHWNDAVVLDVISDEDCGKPGSWKIDEPSAMDKTTEEAWAQHAVCMCEWFDLKKIPDTHYWLDEE